jgi:hypothetical protein
LDGHDNIEIGDENVQEEMEWDEEINQVYFCINAQFKNGRQDH